MMNKEKIVEYCEIIKERLGSVHIKCFNGLDKPLFLISNCYSGVWLEHVYDSVFYATQDRSNLYLAENTIKIFIDNQKEDGQLPCLIRDELFGDPSDKVAYTHTQECVSFASLCLKVYEMNADRDFLATCYESAKKWESWQRTNRMTTGRGLVEMFVGYDTGHDNSGRLQGLKCKGRYTKDGKLQNAAILPEGEEVAPVLAVDMNCNLFATEKSLAKMAEILGNKAESLEYESRAKEVKRLIFDLLYDTDDSFFYDVDRSGNKRKYLSSTVFHLFMEGVLDAEEDRDVIALIYKKHIKNPNEFWTPYPFPSMAVCDPSVSSRVSYNCWGYYTQGLIALRTTLWMDKYGFSEDLDQLCKSWLYAWTESYDTLKFGQELDPISGKPTSSSEWYSSCMLFYLFAAKRLGIIK